MADSLDCVRAIWSLRRNEQQNLQPKRENHQGIWQITRWFRELYLLSFIMSFFVLGFSIRTIGWLVALAFVCVCVFLKLERGLFEWAKCHIEHGNFQAHVYANTLHKRKTVDIKALRANVIHLTASMRTIFMPVLYRIIERGHIIFHGIKPLYI